MTFLMCISTLEPKIFFLEVFLAANTNFFVFHFHFRTFFPALTALQVLLSLAEVCVLLGFLHRTLATFSQRGGGFTQAGVPQRFGRAINFQIHTKLSAGIHPRLRETARYLLVFICYSLYIILLNYWVL